MVGTRASTARKLAAAGPQAGPSLTHHAPIIVDDDNVSVTSELSSVPDNFDETYNLAETDGEYEDRGFTDVDSDNESILSHISVAAARSRAIADDSDSELTELPEDYQDSVFDDGEAGEQVTSLDHDVMNIDMTMDELLDFDLDFDLSVFDDAAQGLLEFDPDELTRDMAALDDAVQALHEHELDLACMDLDVALAGLDARIAAADDNNNGLQDDMADGNIVFHDNMPTGNIVFEDDVAAHNYDEEFAELMAQQANATPAQAAMLATYFASGADLTFDELRSALTMSDELCQWPYGEDTNALDNEFRELMALKRNTATRAQNLVIETTLGYGNPLSFEMFRNILAWGDEACEGYLKNCFLGVYEMYMAGMM
ncbi:hypothetical protein MBLNU457_1862t1 [Dothideomycetes sp. NU457]